MKTVDAEQKTIWEKPVLTIFGTVQEITQQDKVFNSNDGFTMGGQPIGPPMIS